MRYQEADDVVFVTAEGDSVRLKDVLPVVAPAISFVTVACDSGTSLDEIASRVNIYGEGMESSAYRIFDENIKELTDAGFDPGRLEKLRVPL